MADDRGKLGANGTSSESDETFRLYLLCRLGEAERMKLDERLLIDDELAESLLLAESELIDEFAAGKLDAVERESFEKNFLATDSRRKKLRLASALHDYASALGSSVVPVSPSVQPEQISKWGGLAGMLGFVRPRVWAISFAVLIVLVGLAWLVARQGRETVPMIARNEPIPTLSPQISPQPNASPTSLVSPKPEPAPSSKATPTAAEPAAPATVASFVLLPGAVRDGGDLQRVAVPKGERDTVRFNLVLETPPEGVYRAEVATVEGHAVIVRSKLRADGRTGDARVRIDVPAQQLRDGDYQIKLTRQKPDGQLESIGRYYFRALD